MNLQDKILITLAVMVLVNTLGSYLIYEWTWEWQIKTYKPIIAIQKETGKQKSFTNLADAAKWIKK